MKLVFAWIYLTVIGSLALTAFLMVAVEPSATDQPSSTCEKPTPLAVTEEGRQEKVKDFLQSKVLLVEEVVKLREGKDSLARYSDVSRRVSQEFRPLLPILEVPVEIPVLLVADSQAPNDFWLGVIENNGPSTPTRVVAQCFTQLEASASGAGERTVKVLCVESFLQTLLRERIEQAFADTKGDPEKIRRGLVRELKSEQVALEPAFTSVINQDGKTTTPIAFWVILLGEKLALVKLLDDGGIDVNLARTSEEARVCK